MPSKRAQRPWCSLTPLWNKCKSLQRNAYKLTFTSFLTRLLEQTSLHAGPWTSGPQARALVWKCGAWPQNSALRCPPQNILHFNKISNLHVAIASNKSLVSRPVLYLTNTRILVFLTLWGRYSVPSQLTPKLQPRPNCNISIKTTSSPSVKMPPLCKNFSSRMQLNM